MTSRTGATLLEQSCENIDTLSGAHCKSRQSCEFAAFATFTVGSGNWQSSGLFWCFPDYIEEVHYSDLYLPNQLFHYIVCFWKRPFAIFIVYIQRYYTSSQVFELVRIFYGECKTQSRHNSNASIHFPSSLLKTDSLK